VLLSTPRGRRVAASPLGDIFVKSVVHVLRAFFFGHGSKFQQSGVLLLLAEQCKQTQPKRLLAGGLSRKGPAPVAQRLLKAPRLALITGKGTCLC
jgi:hypothetical protein